MLEQACNSFRRKDLKEKCVEVVDKNADYIVDEIIKKTSAKEICRGLGFCDSEDDQESQSSTDMERVASVLLEKYNETPQCVLCELMMTQIEADLKKKSTQEEIESSVRKLCESLPAKYGQKCKKMVLDYLDMMISLASTIPPKELCGELNFCRRNLKKDTIQSEK